MELWIRSQDKEELLKINNRLFIKEIINIGFSVENDLCTDDGFISLGIYNTKERALEVLDEIQSYLIPKIEYLGNKDLLGNDCKFYDINNIQTLVYEMPKE